MRPPEAPWLSLFHIGISIHHINKKSEKQCGLSIVQWCLLKHLIDMPGASAHALARTVGVHPSTLTQSLKRLEKKNYIFVSGDPKDSRKKLISITRAGKVALSTASEKIAIWAEHLSSVSRELRRLRTHLQHHTGDKTQILTSRFKRTGANKKSLPRRSITARKPT